MEPLRYSLCPACNAWPEVVITPGAVTIGEAGNEVRLSHNQWDILIAAARRGDLGPITTPPSETTTRACACDTH